MPIDGKYTVKGDDTLRTTMPIMTYIATSESRKPLFRSARNTYLTDEATIRQYIASPTTP